MDTLDFDGSALITRCAVGVYSPFVYTCDKLSNLREHYKQLRDCEPLDGTCNKDCIMLAAASTTVPHGDQISVAERYRQLRWRPEGIWCHLEHVSQVADQGARYWGRVYPLPCLILDLQPPAAFTPASPLLQVLFKYLPMYLASSLPQH